MASTLSKKFADNEVLFVDSLTFTEPKAAEAKSALAALAKGSKQEMLASKKQNAALLVLIERNEAIEKSFRNFGNVEVAQVKDINPVDLLTYKYVIVAEPAKALEILESRIGATESK